LGNTPKSTPSRRGGFGAVRKTWHAPFVEQLGQQKQQSPARKARRDWRPAFLAAFAEAGSVATACRAAGINRSTVYRERQRDEQFAVAWADTEEGVTDMLEAEALRRAMDGSDRLLMVLLRARRPEVYREGARAAQRSTTHPEAAGLEALSALSDAELIAKISGPEGG